MAGDLLDRIDRAIAELQSIRCEVAALLPAAGENSLLSEEDWLDSTSVAAQLGVPVDTVRWAAKHKSIGRKRAGMWEINLPLARQWFRR